MIDIDFEKKAKLQFHVQKVFLDPARWRHDDYQLEFPLNWKYYKFSPKNRVKVPRSSGVYCFIVKPNYRYLSGLRYLFYIGKTERTLWIRYKEYLNNQQGKGKPRSNIFELLNLYKNDLYFGFVEIDDPLKIIEAEECLINTFVPYTNVSIPEATISKELKDLYR